MKECTQKQFLKDVATHEMTVGLDSGVYRSIRFAAKTNSWNQHFTLTTWPGYLCISGDMGCFVFARLEDMFEFFRASPERGNKLYINTGYWGEKCESEDRRVGMAVYDEDTFRECVKESFTQHEFDNKKDKAACWEEIKAEVLPAQNEFEAFNNAGQFSSHGFEFHDFWEHTLKAKTYQYVWCCYAIAWGIRQYDKRKTTS